MKQNNLDSNWFIQKLQCKNNLGALTNCKNWKKSRRTSVSSVDKLKKNENGIKRSHKHYCQKHSKYMKAQ